MTPRQPEPVPDIEFSSSVEADELRFRETPRTEVTFSGGPGTSTVKRGLRVNLPEPVEPGADYSGVRVEYDFAVSVDLPDSDMDDR